MLECSLIKQYSPKYNILLKDDKGYHYIRVSPGPWAKISEWKGNPPDDGARYIGPFLSFWAVREAVDEARKIFLLPSCNRRFPQDLGKGRPLPQLLYQTVLRALPGEGERGGVCGKRSGSGGFSDGRERRFGEAADAEDGAGGGKFRI